MKTYSPASEPDALVAKLVPEDFSLLGSASVKCLFVEEPIWDRGRACAARIHHVTDLYKHLTGLDFVVEIHKAAWDDFDQRQRLALIAHELSHADINKHGEFKVKSHDVEEFLDVAEKYGRWHDGLEELGKIMDAQHRGDLTCLFPARSKDKP